MSEFNKIPTPHSIEAEQSVLGALMLVNDSYDVIVDVLCEDDFYRNEHKVIFSCIESLANKNMPFDVLTISDLMKSHKEKPVEEYYLFELAKNTPSAANIAAYAKIVREKSVLRQLAKVGYDISQMAYHPSDVSVAELLNIAENKVFSISDQTDRKSAMSKISTIMVETLEKIDNLYKKKGQITGLSSGFLELDKMTSGLQKSDFIIIGGRPSMGKTTLAMNIAENAALNLANKENSGAIIVFSLEMPEEQLAMRMFSSMTKIPQQNMRTGKLQDADWPKIMETAALFQETNLLIDDTPGITPASIRSRVRRVAKEYGCVELIVVDYLQLMSIPGYGNNRVAEVAEISRSLKAIAKEFDCPVIAGSQLNRSLESRQDKRPIMSDIRESGGLEQDADLILFIYRDEVYNKETAERNHAEIIIAKHRNGAIGSFSLTFDGASSRFDNYADPRQYIPNTTRITSLPYKDWD